MVSKFMELEAVGCVFDDRHFIGFGASRVYVEFESAPLGGSLPPLVLAEVDGLDLRLRDMPVAVAAPRDEASPGSEEPSSDRAEDASADDGGDTQRRIEEETLRFLDFSRAVDQGRGGEPVPALLERLTDGGTVRIERTTLRRPGGESLLSDIHAVVERAGDGLSVAIAAELGTGGLVALDGRLSEAGLADARIRLEHVPVAAPLSHLGGEQLQVQAGEVSGDLRYRAGSWSVDLGLEGLLVREESIGQDWLPLPTIQLLGDLVPRAENGSLKLTDGLWRISGIGGELTGSLGPLGSQEPAHVELHMNATRLALGQLLGALPDSLMPSEWAEEIQGTLDISIDFTGPLHERKEWDLDWEADFSRMVLASGSLAREVSRLRSSFEHSFPSPPGQTPTTRTIGPEDPRFVAIGNVSPHLLNAVVSTEDAGFFLHSGFEESSLKEAVLENLREGGGRGGSTITQQLAKNLFLSGERTFARKLKEAIIAWRLESDLPKTRLLEIYLNIAEWGPGVYGAREAADHYFARTPRVLRPEEAAFLASLLPSPRRFHDYYHGARGLSSNRYTMVQDILRSMQRMGMLSAVDYHLARGEPVELIACDR